MKKYLILSIMFLLMSSPALAKGTSDNSIQNRNLEDERITISPSESQVKNENQIQVQNKGEEKEINTENQENEALNSDLDQSLAKVSDQVHKLIETSGAKGGIGQQVKEIAQNQIKNQEEIKENFDELKNRGSLVKMLIGSDKKTVQSLEQKLEQNKTIIQQLEELKLRTNNTSDLQQIQETIDLLNYQNTSLQNTIDSENKVKGIFGWLVNIFNK